MPNRITTNFRLVGPKDQMKKILDVFLKTKEMFGAETQEYRLLETAGIEDSVINEICDGRNVICIWDDELAPTDDGHFEYQYDQDDAWNIFAEPILMILKKLDCDAIDVFYVCVDPDMKMTNDPEYYGKYLVDNPEPERFKDVSKKLSKWDYTWVSPEELEEVLQEIYPHEPGLKSMINKLEDDYENIWIKTCDWCPVEDLT